MRKTHTVVLALLTTLCSTACRPDFSTLEEACDGKVKGANKIENQDAIDVFARIGCYRRLAKMTRPYMQFQVQEAVENHNAYQQIHTTEEGWNADGMHSETSGLPGYTGADAYTRLEAVDYQGIEQYNLSYWTYSFWDNADAVERVDFWFPDPQSRQAFLQPSWIAGGYAEGPIENFPGERIAYMNIFYQVPVVEASGRPIFYPKDGQLDVPTGFEAVEDDNPMFGQGLIGYPITLTVGSMRTDGGGNAHGIEIHSSKLTGPQGPVEMQVFTPDLDPWMLYTAAFYPLTEFTPNSDYTFEVELSWHDHDHLSYEIAFSTGPQSVPHGFDVLLGSGRGIPERPVRHHRALGAD